MGGFAEVGIPPQPVHVAGNKAVFVCDSMWIYFHNKIM